MLDTSLNRLLQAAALAAAVLLHAGDSAALDDQNRSAAPSTHDGSTSAVGPGTPKIPAPSAGAPPQPVADPSSDFDADRRLAERLAVHAAAGPTSQVDYCLRLAWSTDETDDSLRSAALRTLRRTDSRVVAESVMVQIDEAPVPARIGMMQLMVEMFSTLGGEHSSLNQALAEQIRFPIVDVARAAITACSQLRLPEAYLPMREIATRRDAPLRTEAIIGLSRLGDPRAVELFRKLLDEGSTPRDEIYTGLARLGRPASLLLKSKLDDKDPLERRRALNALLGMATVDDLTALYAYVQKYTPEGEIKQQIYDTIATIEARNSERRLGGND